MKAIVTGAAGFLGSKITERLRSAGWDVTALARLEGPGLTPLDLSDLGTVWRLLDSVKPTVIVNCAATVDFGPHALFRQYPVNVVLPGVLAQWCRKENAHLVQASATLVHGTACESIRDDSPLNADTDYGRSKLLAEELVAASGCRAAVLRFGGLFGASGPDHLGLNRAIRCASVGEVPVVTGKGLAIRNYLHVEDASAMIEHCLNIGLTGTHLAAGSESLTIRQMLETVCDVYVLNTNPKTATGPDARDQIIETSSALPVARSFRTALEAEK